MLEPLGFDELISKYNYWINQLLSVVINWWLVKYLAEFFLSFVRFSSILTSIS